MICIYEHDCTDFATNGMGVLKPLTCEVTETLNGEWELELTHDIDDAGKWTLLQVGRILRAPVPAAMTPRMNQVSQISGGDTGGGTVLSELTASMSAYSKNRKHLDHKLRGAHGHAPHEYVTGEKQCFLHDRT